MTRGVQTQLTEEQVRKWRAEADHALDVSDVLGERIVSQRVVALADAYLAQQRTIEAARSLWNSLDNECYGADFTMSNLMAARFAELEAALAAVSVGSPETRETE